MKSGLCGSGGLKIQCVLWMCLYSLMILNVINLQCLFGNIRTPTQEGSLHLVCAPTYMYITGRGSVRQEITKFHLLVTTGFHSLISRPVAC